MSDITQTADPQDRTAVTGTAVPDRELADIVRATIADVLGTETDAIKDSTDLQAEYGIDSLELMAVGAQLERALGIRIETEDLFKAETVGHAIALLAARKAES
ncbi:acyl carrier protein [Streptomyces sp. MST-110588]|uniref:acyl carrier protein n=1 Tax=Streptomyces sp. MST-110588 TaxID=2833628 RepID=UPI001F5CE289|nr:acyl carrier protein [Streptomyces sp. MST-110588]UNO38556.1 acyl carrier protein [Streptomyces sp. MST-110588]